MTLSTLDTISALVVIDTQKGIVSLPTVHPSADIVDRIRQLTQAFRKRNLPVILVNVAGLAPGRTETGMKGFNPPAEWIELIDELEHQPEDHLITKHRWGAFHGTALDDLLRGSGATQVVLAGIATSMGVESTARSAYDLGYNVALAVDAMTDLNHDAHKHSVEKIFPMLGEISTTDEVLAFLA